MANQFRIEPTFTNDPLSDFRLTRAMVHLADEQGPIILEELRRQVPDASGRLKRSLFYTRESAIGVVRMKFQTKTPYFPYVIHGTRPHTIQAVAARSLHFIWNGSDFFAKSVNHPGTRPNDFVTRAWDRVKEPLTLEFIKVIESEVGGK